jgi:hypothetical protein
MMARFENWSIGRGLKAALIAQCVIAVLLIFFDMNNRWTWPSSSPDGPLEGPVEPGDQVRHYEPEAPRPIFMMPPGSPSVALPDDVPERLEFSVITSDELGEVLLLNGVIEDGDARRFAAYVESLETVPDTIILNSPGGIVDEALLIGRGIRERDLQTAVLTGMYCVSSCPYLLAGGTERRVARDAVVGLHQHYYETPRYIPVYFAVESIQQGQGRTMQFLIDMGVSAELLLFSLTTSPQDIYVLVEDELLSTKLATEMLE